MSCTLYNFITEIMEEASQLNQSQTQYKLQQLSLEQIQENVTTNHSVIPQENYATVQNVKNNKPKTKKVQVKKIEKGVEDNPQYYRVDFQVCHKLYEIYRRLRIGATQQQEGFSFDQREQGNNCMNYHKIMQMFKDIDVRLQINQKLMILRAIKKFCFNQNFINQQEFTKIFKVIVHGLSIKQAVFKTVIQSKYTSVVQKEPLTMQRRAISIKLNKNFGSKLRTEPALQNLRMKSQVSEQAMLQSRASNALKSNLNNSYLKKPQSVLPAPVMEESYISTSRKMDRTRKKMVTEASRYDPPTKTYLNRAMEKSKMGKVTWDSLFKMTEASLHHNICVPEWVSLDMRPEEQYF